MNKYDVSLYARIPISDVSAHRMADAIDNATLILHDLLRDVPGVGIAEVGAVVVVATEVEGESE